jgi:hypothetical protein
MYIEIRGIDRIGYGGNEIILPSELIRYIEFENCVVFLVNAGGKRNQVVSVKFRHSPNEYYVAWSFVHRSQIMSLIKFLEEGKEYVKIKTWDDLLFILDPETGSIIFESPTKG